jgi:hypothetical protein
MTPAGAGSGIPCACDEILLDWAVSELCSESWAGVWTGAAAAGLRARIAADGVETLSADERLILVDAIRKIRAPIIRIYGPAPSWRCARITVPRAELERFAILPWFGHPTFSFVDLMRKVRDEPESDPRMAAGVEAIVAARRGGRAPRGRLIATMPRAFDRPVLIDGYHRGMAALLLNDPAVEAYMSLAEAG